MSKIPSCPVSGFRFAPVQRWLHVKHAAETGESLFYRAPLDRTPRRVIAKRVFKNGKVRFQHSDVTFTADESHLERFFKLAPLKEG